MKDKLPYSRQLPTFSFTCRLPLVIWWEGKRWLLTLFSCCNKSSTSIIYNCSIPIVEPRDFWVTEGPTSVSLCYLYLFQGVNKEVWRETDLTINISGLIGTPFDSFLHRGHGSGWAGSRKERELQKPRFTGYYFPFVGLLLWNRGKDRLSPPTPSRVLDGNKRSTVHFYECLLSHVKLQ